MQSIANEPRLRKYTGISDKANTNIEEHSKSETRVDRDWLYQINVIIKEEN